MGISLEQLTNSVNKVMTKVKDKFVLKEEGKGLSTNDYSTEDKSKVAKIDDIENSVKNVSSQIFDDSDIPKVFLNGDNFQNMTINKNEVEMDMEYISKLERFKCAIKIKFQGNSTLIYPKKNFSIKMYEDNTYTKSFKKNFMKTGLKTNKYVLKANYIDLSHARNVGSARLWGEIVRNRLDFNAIPDGLKNSPNQGAIDGFVIKLYVNGSYQGRYTWNLAKANYLYGVSENEINGIFASETGMKDSELFKAEPILDGTDWSDELFDTTPDNIKASFKNAINFVINNNGDDFKEGLSAYFDINSLIDYYIFAYTINHWDGFQKNQIFTTYDGNKWFANAYDMDATVGLWYTGDKFLDTNYSEIAIKNNLYIKLLKNFSNEIRDRYNYLRKNVLSISNLINNYERITDISNSDLVKEDYAIYPDIPSQTTNNIQQIRNYLIDRLKYTDEYFGNMGINETVSYIESTGAQYIDTGYIPNHNTNIEIKLNVTDNETINDNISMWGVEKNKIRFVLMDNNYPPSDSSYLHAYYCIGNTSDFTSAIDFRKKDTIFKMNNTGISYNGTNIATYSINDFNVGANLYLFAKNVSDNNTVIGYSKMKLYYCKIWDNDNLVRDFVPAEREGVFGLLDKVENKFYTNNGEGVFDGHIN